MSRSKKFARSLASGYVLLGVNILYTLAQWPLALRYLSNRELALWVVVTTLSANLQLLVDLGMSGSISRILVDHKDDQTSDRYGVVIKTGLLTLLVQGVLIALIGGLASVWLPQWMNIDAEFVHPFRWLMIGQCVLVGASFAGRIFTFILQAHQRYDLGNYSLIGGFVVNLLTLWIAFELHLGLYSLLVATAANLLFSNAFCLLAVWWMKFFPAAPRRGRVDWATFRDIFAYATDIFLLSVGQVLISVSQVPLITLMLGLETAAVWSALTKTFMLAQQLIARIFDFSSSPFAEMMVRGERERLRARFRDVVILTASVGVVACLGVALGNGSFVHLWMQGRFSWDAKNDLLMALFIIVGTSTRCHVGLAGLTKDIRAMKYVYVIEGVAFVALGSALAPRWGLAGIIVSGIASNLVCSGLYGLWRTTEYLQFTPREFFLGWLKFPARLFLILLAAAVGLWFALRSLAPLPQLLADTVGLGLAGGFCFWRLGLPEHLRQELALALGKVRARLVGGK